MVKDDPRERRKFPRAQAAVPVRLSIQGKSKSFEARVQSYDASLSGIFLASEFFLRPGLELDLDFRLPNDERRIQVRGAIVREIRDDAQSGFAVRFTEYHGDAKLVLATAFLKADLTKFIDDYLRHRPRRPRTEAEQLRDVVIAWELGKMEAQEAEQALAPAPAPRFAAPAPVARGRAEPVRLAATIAARSQH